MGMNEMMADGPIPGENYTSDTRNYPWHRPPEYTDLDDAIEASFKKLTDEENYIGLLTMLELGATVVQVTDMFITSGIGAGKWTPDFGILLAGPVAHIIYMMSKAYGIDCELGINPNDRKITTGIFDGYQEVNKKKAKAAMELVKVEKAKAGSEQMQASGMMGMALTSNEAPVMEGEY